METYGCHKAGVDLRPTLKINDKSASTNSITFSAIDPKRADGRTYSLFYEPLDEDGNIVNRSADATVDW